jgi:serine/threonine-protein kinase
MEYVEGEPLDQYCDRARLDVRARLRLFAQVCEGVAFAHRNLVLHRDLKPSNLMVTEEGRAKVVDFGTATLLDPGRLVTISGAPLTPGYASPEQLTGRPVGTASDQYSLGLVLFELLAGAPAFGERRSLVTAIERAVSGIAPAALSAVVTEEAAEARQTTQAALARTLSGDLATIVSKALTQEPERRYASVQHMADDLQRWAEGEPVLARPTSVGYRVRKFARRHTIEVAAVAVAVVALVGGLLAAMLQARRAEAETQRATAVTRFLTTMLGSADPGALGKDVTVREVLEKATTNADALDSTPKLASAVRGVIGQTFLSLGDYDASVKQLALAVAAEKRAAPGRNPEIVRLMTKASLAHQSAGRLEEATRSLDEAAAVLQQLSRVDPEIRADYLDQRGRVFAEKGDFVAAREAFGESRDFVRAAGLGFEARANAAANLAFALANLGRFAEAKPLYEEAIADTRRATGPESNAVADILSPYASVLWYLKERESALGVYEESIRIRRRTLGPEHPGYAMTLANYADSLVTLEQYSRALPLLREILALRGRTLPDSHNAVAATMLLMGRALGPLGQLDEAEDWMRKAIAVREKVLAKGDWRIASGRSILGGHLVLAKRFAEAETLLVDAERELAATLGNDSPIVTDSRQRLVGLYTAWNRPQDAARWQSQLPVQTP